MEGSNKSSENGVIVPELKPDSGPVTFNITVSYGLDQHQVGVPSNSTFGDLKSVIAQKKGLKPENLKLLFRGKEKEDGDHLLTAGVKDNSKVLLLMEEEEDTTSVQRSPEKVETIIISRGGEAVAVVREEIDKLAEQVAALQAVVDGGTKVDDKDFLFLTEMLMRQLLKLDGIEAEGEGKVQRKMEVRRVQSFVETMDILKSKNANHSSNNNDAACVTTQWETFESGFGSESTLSTEPSSPPTTASYIPTPASAPSPTPASALSPTPAPAPSPSPSPSPAPAPAPAPVTYSTNTPIPFSVPGSTPVLSSSPSHLPSATKVTQDWEHFD
ncbi:hypothetical protein C2S52_006599 [Perilla frutescens var. hirtella]|nr:hypothetical protein C2S52_006599 [Perilla frutescens var. hirtella]